MRAKPSWWLVLAALTVMWGSSYLLIEFALRGFSPSQLAGIRIVLAALVLLGVMLASGDRLPRDRVSWVYLAGIATIGNCVPFMLIAFGQQQVESGLAAILVAMTPLCVVGLGHVLLPDGRLTLLQTSGFLLGFVGVVVLMGPESLRAIGGSPTNIVAQLAILGGAVCYAISTILTARMPDVKPLPASTAVMLMAGVLMLPSVASVGPDIAAIPLKAWIAVIVLGVIGTATTAILYFWLVARAGARFTSLFNYLIPLWAVSLGMAVLNERPGAGSFVALVLIIGGVMLTQWQSGKGSA